MTRTSLLHHIEQGSGSPVVLLHGFTGSIEAMKPLSDLLADRHRVIAVDLAGHGKSPSPATDYAMAAAVDDVAAIVTELDLAPVHLLGYSMGGRVALSYAVARPGDVASVVTIGASPGISDATRRADRAAADAALADRIEDKGIEWFVDYWSALPLLRPVTERGATAAGMMRSVRSGNDPAALAAALRTLGTGTMPPLVDSLADLEVPALLLAGASDARYRTVAIGLAAAMPGGRFAVVDDAGHAAHLDDPEAVAAATLEFFADVEARSAG